MTEQQTNGGGSSSNSSSASHKSSLNVPRSGEGGKIPNLLVTWRGDEPLDKLHISFKVAMLTAVPFCIVVYVCTNEILYMYIYTSFLLTFIVRLSIL